MGGLVQWNGDRISAKVRAASVGAVRDTLAAAVDYARANHDWITHSGVTEEDIDMLEPEITPTGVSGQWGGGGVAAIDLELGTALMPARPFLRPAGDAVYPDLPGRLRERYLA